ncbi:SEC-C motif-containing protein [Halanaerobium saccharolyticum]|uniref:SEC-C motif-containing protein n=1 Tax=Halanaerobium saccharolyticum TaxID=43595 RepID=A0A2T5RHL2_9FIRM|nr:MULTISPECIES: SEC-C metal-binding domain-containing protein [Halanaerobium]PTV96170.1 SEC-C motif-containing protein [Halanaerobium saccharolyticum]PUU94100.1 MAG: SEC-C motif domain-containing protein [Halanaerobium sp.]
MDKRLKGLKESIAKRREKDTVRSYSIGRNEPCPCGSGKKFKKCCARNNPEKSVEEYFEAIKNAENEEEVLNLLKDAVKNYPLEHRFLLPLIVYSLQSNNYQEAGRYLRHAWQLMGTDLDEAFISPLVNIMLDQEEIDEAEALVRQALEDKGESIPLLIALAEVYKKGQNFQRVNDIIERAMQIDAENLQLIVFRLETLMDLDDVVSALSLFEKYYDQLKEYKHMRVISFLDDFIKERFNLKGNKKLKQKEALSRAAKIFNVFQQLDNLKMSKAETEGRKLLAEIKELAPKNSQIALDILSRYLAAELYQDFADFAEELEAEHMKNPDFLRLLFLADYQQGNLKAAEEKIKTAFTIEKSRKDGHFHNWQVASDYLRFLVDHGEQEDLADFVSEFAELIDDEKNLLASLMMLIENEETRNYQKTLLESLLNLIDAAKIDQISKKDIYNNRLFISLAALDGDETIYDQGREMTTEELKSVIAEVEAAGVETPALSYARLRLLKYQSELQEDRKEELVARVKEAEIESYFDTVAYYETILRFGDPAPILTEIPHGKFLDDEYLDFYRLIAALKLNYYEMGTELFHRQLMRESKRNKVMSYLVRLLRYFKEDKLIEHFKAMEVDEVIINYLKKLTEKRN